MELKSYQQDVLNDLRTYFDYLGNHPDPATAFDQYWEDRIGPYNPITRKGMRPYLPTIPEAVHLCIKVPTAGGKTFIACNALKVIFDRLPQDEPRAVVWLVPWSNLLEQTVKNLSDPNHPYRQKLNALFNHRVDVYQKDQLLQGASFNPGVVREQLSIFVMSFASLRARNKDDRKVYQENGQLASFADLLSDREHVLDNTDETALINVIRSLSPVVVVDESHNAESDLSVDMLKALNPRCILDLTATPKENSNIVSMVSAIKLKKEHMVKLPIIAYNHREKTEVIDSALHLRRSLETMAIAEQKAGGKYIRPIVLFQAQPRTGEDNTTFEKLKALLIKAKIPEEQIKIKTATINELKGVDLLSPSCPVRYIITVNALKEGWDCPFAYILASLADRSSAVDVEQIVGRVLRQPYVTAHQQTLLNMSYVLTASLKFEETLKNIIKGLEAAGFSEKDYRSENKVTPEDIAQARGASVQQEFFGNTDAPATSPDDIDPERLSFDPTLPPEPMTVLDEIVELAQEEAQKTEAQMNHMENNPQDPILQEMKDQVVMYPMRADVAPLVKDLLLPKFYLKIPTDGLLSGMDGSVEVSRNNLLRGFRLTNYNTQINFAALAAEVYQIDIEESGTQDVFRPSASKIKKVDERNYIMEHILAKPKESQIKDIAHRLRKHLGELSPISEPEVTKHLTRVLEDMPSNDFTEILNRELTFGRVLKQKIHGFMDEYAEKQFNMMIEISDVFMQPVWKFPEVIIPGAVGSNIVNALYEKEGSVNNFEYRIIMDVASMENIVFWHRNLGRGKGFAINGFKSNHYPDFIILTKKGKLVVLETKGDDRDNSDSQAKVRLGNTWATQAGPAFKYFMVFEKNSIPGAYTLEQFREIMERL
jgi:type III restriction enzyme